MAKRNEGSRRVWLDPQKNTTGVPVPQWEGTSNPPPMYMDLVLYTMHKITKTKLKPFIQVHKQMSMQEILSTFCYFDPFEHVICLPDIDTEYVLYVSKHELGHVVAYSNAGDYGEKINNNKWDYVIVEFEDRSGWSVAKGVKINGASKANNGKKLLTMHDNNFILAKACKMIETEDLKKHLEDYFSENLQNRGENEILAR